MIHFLYGLLAVVGLVDLALVTPALRAATSRQVLGRLLSTLAVLGGLVLGAGARLYAPPPANPAVIAGLVLIDIGLAGYAVYLPGTGLHGITRRRRRRGNGKDRGSAT